MQKLPKTPFVILNWFCNPKYSEEVSGDLEEIFLSNLERKGRFKSLITLWIDVIRHIRPYFLRNNSSKNLTQTAMLGMYLKIGLRNIRKRKLISAINIGGLSLALTCSILLAFHVSDELSYDQTLENGQKVFRMLNIEPGANQPIGASGPPPLGPTLKQDLSWIHQSARLWEDYDPVLEVNENKFVERSFMFTDPSFFELFSFNLESGSKETALEEPNSVILTESMVAKYFGNHDPMGKTISYDGGRGDLDFVVTGVMKDLPHNTHMKIDFLASFSSVKRQSYWGSFKPLWTYVTLEPDVSQEQIAQDLGVFAAKYVKDRVGEHPGWKFDMEPVSDIHLLSEADVNMKPLGSMKSVYVAISIGISLLVIAMINFLNLTMASTLTRAKEIGIRKTIGARNKQLIGQFGTEIGLNIAISFIIAVTGTILTLPIYNVLSSKEISIGNLATGEFVTTLSLGLLLLFILGLAYPMFLINRLNKLERVDGDSSGSKSSFGLKKVLIALQFTISGSMIVGLLVIRDQLDFIQNKSIGIEKENVLVVPRSKSKDLLITNLKSFPEILSVGISQRLPVNMLNYDGRSFEVEGHDKSASAQSCVIEGEFLETYGVQLLAGRDHRSGDVDTWEFIVNETAVKEWGWDTPENALGKKVYFDREDTIIGNVIGVFADFHLESLHEKIPPMIMFKNIKPEWPWWGGDFISMRFKTSDLNGLVTKVEDSWRHLNPDGVYSSFFIDDSFHQLHEEDRKFSSMIDAVGVIAILISIVGLFGLSMMMVQQRVKEIGIRKVLGASVARLTTMLVSNFVLLITISLVLAVPISYFFLENWLSNFSYRIAISPLQFLIALIAILVLGLISIGFQTLKAAMSNPVDSLRKE